MEDSFANLINEIEGECGGRFENNYDVRMRECEYIWRSIDSDFIYWDLSEVLFNILKREQKRRLDLL